MVEPQPMEDAGQLNFERRTRAAEGFIELGMVLDADAELEEIEPELRTDTQVHAEDLGSEGFPQCGATEDRIQEDEQRDPDGL